MMGTPRYLTNALVVSVEVGWGIYRILLCVLRIVSVALDFTQIAEIELHSCFRCRAERQQ